MIILYEMSATVTYAAVLEATAYLLLWFEDCRSMADKSIMAFKYKC